MSFRGAFLTHWLLMPSLSGLQCPPRDMGRSTLHPLATLAVLSGLQLPPGAHGQAGGLDTAWETLPALRLCLLCFVT